MIQSTVLLPSQHGFNSNVPPDQGGQSWLVELRDDSVLRVVNRQTNYSVASFFVRQLSPKI